MVVVALKILLICLFFSLLTALPVPKIIIAIKKGQRELKRRRGLTHQIVQNVFQGQKP